MITASEARRKSRIKLNNAVASEITMIRQEIDKAIDKGEFSFSGSGNLRTETVNTLRDLGYSVKIGSQYNESYYTISWKGEEE